MIRQCSRCCKSKYKNKETSSSGIRNMPSVEDKFFTPHGFISLVTRTTSTLSWILGKPLLKPKRAHIYTKRRQNPWFKLIAHHFIFRSGSKLMSLIKGILGVVVWKTKKYVQ